MIVPPRPSSVTASSGISTKRGRGRPPLTHDEAQAVRDRIQAAAASVFAQQGYHGVSVELILKAGCVSRPTFYRYFRNTDEVIELVLRDVNDSLISTVTRALRDVEGPLQKVEAGLLAWRRWGEKTGPLLKAIFAEIHDPHSPAASHRQRVLDALSAELNQVAADLGRKPFNPLQIEAFVIGVEYLGYRFHFGAEGPTDEAWQHTRQAMLRLALGLLGGSHEWAHAVQLSDVLGLSLD